MKSHCIWGGYRSPSLQTSRTMRGRLARQAGGLPSVWRTFQRSSEHLTASAGCWENVTTNACKFTAKGSEDSTISKLCTTSSCSLSEHDMTTIWSQLLMFGIRNTMKNKSQAEFLEAHRNRQHALTCFGSLTRQPEPPRHGQIYIMKLCLDCLDLWVILR